MPTPIQTLLAAFLAAGLAACAISPAQMQRPADLQAGAAATPISGLGGGGSGRFHAGGHVGDFSRSAEQLSFFGVDTRRSGTTRFTLEGPAFASPVSADCRMSERTLTIDILDFRPGPMAYACAFTGASAQLELQAAQRGLTNLEHRHGTISLDGASLSIRSVHQIEGAALPVSAPIGYVFERNGQAVGAVEINGAPVMLEGAAATPAERRAILLASLALSILWDPASTA